MPAQEIPIVITRGKTFEYGFLYAEDTLIYKQITAMPTKAPVQLTVAGHGLPDGWPVRVTCLKAPADLNTADGAYDMVRVVDADTIEFNDKNATCWKNFAGPGVLVFSQPVDLTGWACRAQVRDKVGGTVLFSWHSDPLENPDGEAEVDVARSAFILRMDAGTAAALTWKRGIYDFEAVSPDGNVYPLTAISQISVEDEVTA